MLANRCHPLTSQLPLRAPLVVAVLCCVAPGLRAQSAFEPEPPIHSIGRTVLSVETDEEVRAFVRDHRRQLTHTAEAVLELLANTYRSGVELNGPPAVQRRALVELLATSSRGTLVDLTHSALGDDDAYVRCAGLRLLRTLDRPGDLDLFLLTLGPMADGSNPPHRVRQTFQCEFTGWLQRQPLAMGEVVLARPAFDEESTVAFLRALASSERPDALPVLERALFAGTVPPRTVLAEIGRLAPSLPRDTCLELSSRLVEYLDPSDAPTCQAASEALGRLGSRTPVPLLIPLLDSDTHGVRESAHWALRSITGVMLRPEARRWRNWYDLELDWYRASGSALPDQLVSEDPALVAEALRACSEHPLFAEEFALQLGVPLTHTEASVRLFAVHVIGRLRPERTRTDVVLATEDVDDEVANAALKLLADWPAPKGESRFQAR